MIEGLVEASHELRKVVNAQESPQSMTICSNSGLCHELRFFNSEYCDTRDSHGNPRKALSRISARVLVLVSTLPLFARSKVR